eukprot:NODE_310_length_11257_cov_0.344417.p4 type:complete len:214 gc:universal NODE_310_length_11257_cov_0.344417:1464-2105(+)
MLPIKLLERSNSQAARNILEACYRYVLPLIRDKGLILQITEFFPSSPNLLGMNKGQKSMVVLHENSAVVKQGWDIFIRLRHSKFPNKFISKHNLIGTILHEIVHCYIGPHNREFYKLLDEFWIKVQYMNLPVQNLSNDHTLLGRSRSSKTGGKTLGGFNKPLNNATLTEAVAKRIKMKDNTSCGTLSNFIDFTNDNDIIDFTNDNDIIDLTHL